MEFRHSCFVIPNIRIIRAIRGSSGLPRIRVHWWLNGTSLTASYEEQIREVWEKASIQKREQRMTRGWGCKIHRTRHGKKEWCNEL